MTRFKTLKELKADYGDNLEINDNGCTRLKLTPWWLWPECLGLPLDQAPADWNDKWLRTWMVTKGSTHDGQGKCECGAEIAGGFHSDWCPMYQPVLG